MIRSMFSAVSGLRAHRTMLDVVGNNIANSSTAGFKSSSTVFEDVLSETVRNVGAGAEDGTTGGTNPSQIGLGVAVSRISTNFSQGALQSTGRQLDFAIRGDGFFVAEGGGDRSYTRAGSMSLDAQGRLVAPGGELVQGWTADALGVVDPNTAVGQITVPIGTTAPPVATSTIDLAGNLPADAQIGDSFVSGVQVFNSLGDTEMLGLNFEKTAANEWTVTATDSAGTAVALTDNVLTFDANGQLTAPADGGIDLAAGAIPGFDAMTVNINSGIGNVTQFGELSTLAVADQNGYGAGILQSISMSQEGMLLGSFSNGVNRPLAQLAIANFTNPEGLEKTGSSMF
ncbi:MAG: flagellar hook protein FlgE, partial [Ilumatobacteraceae bacterium]